MPIRIILQLLFIGGTLLAETASVQAETGVTREMFLQKKYLNLPVKNGAAKQRMSINCPGQPNREFEIELADRDPDFWVFLNIEHLRGQRAILSLPDAPANSIGLEHVQQSDEIEGGGNIYLERLRPQFHFSSRRGWNNDPNGLVFSDGAYHLFYQHNPYGWSWGNMHWGHATSPDLVHWQELPDALLPDQLGTMFSGSAVVDAHNTAGFARADEKPIVCVYTAAGGTSHESQGKQFSQCLAYSNDRGQSWTKLASNPVLPHVVAENRDPKVIWFAPQKKWVMALYLDKSDYALFSSPDLKHWEKLSDINLPGSSECPEFFEIPIEGKQGETRWIFYGGNGRYLIGTFNGKAFTPETGPLSLHFGNCFYASQTYNGLTDGRRILIGWGQINLPGMPFNQMMDFPVELKLSPKSDGLRLLANPVREIERLYRSKREFAAGPIKPGENLLSDLHGELFDIDAELEIGQASRCGFKIRGVPVEYNAQRRELACLDKKTVLEAINGKIRLRILVDRASIEIFGNDGAVYMPMGVIPQQENQSLELFAVGGEGRVASLLVRPLNTIWPH